ncbi:MAG: TetR/AcrR family transcriptional regulator [Bacteroidota bacterium]|nr:TetR/AcrR family transcriptional regulator [Bacteroidota bacterium]MDP3144729.1 TetR/AcrR family transcriptional regulator [Bacteroidota bacterium]MDP3557894.1 TetR/AcrR family transcriptional regulator [Bacteroidota bacterium]
MPKLKQFDKDKVLQAASDVFQKNGYNGSSIDDILTATGLSRSSLYDSFKDKHNLYLESLEFYKNSRSNSLDTLNKKDLNGLQKIEIMFTEVVKHLINNPNDNGCLLVNAAAEMSKQCFKTSQVICNNKDEVQELITSWLTDAQTKKALKLSKPAKVYSQYLYNTLLGLRVMSQSGATKVELNNVVKTTIESLI